MRPAPIRCPVDKFINKIIVLMHRLASANSVVCAFLCGSPRLPLPGAGPNPCGRGFSPLPLTGFPRKSDLRRFETNQESEITLRHKGSEMR